MHGQAIVAREAQAGKHRELAQKIEVHRRVSLEIAKLRFRQT